MVCLIFLFLIAFCFRFLFYLSLSYSLTTNVFVYVEITENSKKGNFDTSPFHRRISHLGMNQVIFFVSTFLYMHVLNFTFEHVQYEIGIIMWFGFINIRYPKNEVPWKYWLDP